MYRFRISICVILAIVFITVGCSGDKQNHQAKIEQTAAQVRRVAEKLDKQTTPTGVYIRVDDADIKETDAWGTKLEVSYSQGGVAETLTVRSAGSDREFHSADDIVAGGTAMNLRGIGEGVKQNIEGTAANAAKGVVKGTVEGVKESFSRKKKVDAGADNAEDAKPEDK